VDEDKYSPDQAPPESGWKSAVKFFTKDGETSVKNDDTSDASNDSRLVLDNIIYVNNKLGSPTDIGGRWGLNFGYEWDSSWITQGVYLQYLDYRTVSQASLLTGWIFPNLESQFPLYLKANVGLGYFTGDINSDTLSADYNAFLGVRIFTESRFLFNVEFGSKNYHRLFRKSYANSWVISSGLSVLF
jgi:hypothetical protein